MVACRSKVYKAIRGLRPDAGLQFATTVTLQPLSAEDIFFHLEQYRDELGRAEVEWAPVTEQLDHADGVLATALRTPWLLSLAATALKRRPRHRPPSGLRRVAIPPRSATDSSRR